MYRCTFFNTYNQNITRMDWIKQFTIFAFLIMRFSHAETHAEDCSLECLQIFASFPHKHFCVSSEQFESYTYLSKCFTLTHGLMNKLTVWLAPTYNAYDSNYRIPKNDFFVIAKAERLGGIAEIEPNFMNGYIHLYWFQITYNRRISKLKPFTFNGSSVEIINLGSNEIKSTDNAFIGSKNVRELHLEFNPLSILTNNTFNGLVQLELLYLHWCHISVIELEAFENLPNLQLLNLGGNSLIQLDGDIFKNNDYLTVILLYNNALRQVSFKNKMESLKQLALHENNIDYIDGYFFEGLINLMKISISVNRLTYTSFNFSSSLRSITVYFRCNIHSPSIVQGAFKTKSVLQEFILDGLCVQNIDSKMFDGLEASTIAIVRTEIREIKSDTFDGILNMNRIDIQLNSNLINIEPMIFKRHNRLGSVHMIENKIQSIRKWFSSESNRLETLNLRNNEIAHIESGSFEGLQRLMYLDLSNNRIKILDSLSHLFSLSMVDLSTNLMEEFSMLQIVASQDLKFLNLSNNELTKMAFPGFGTVKTVILDNNKITFLTCLNFTSNIEHLSLKQNHITHVELINECPIFKHTVELDLSYNWIRDIKIAIALGPYTLTLQSFNLSHNKIPNLDFLQYMLDHLKTTSVDLRFNEVMLLSNETAHTIMTNEVHLENNPWQCSCDEKYNLMNKILLRSQITPCCPQDCACIQSSKPDMVIDCQNSEQITLPSCNPISNTILDYANTQIHYIDDTQNFQNVIGLNLSNNHLTEKDFNLNSSASHLQYIDLSKNDFLFLDESTAKTLLAIKHKVLTENPWECSCNPNHSTMMGILLRTLSKPPCCPKNCVCQYQDSVFIVNCSRVQGAELPFCLPYKKVYLDYSYSNFNRSFSNVTNLDNIIGMNLSHNDMVTFSLNDFYMQSGLQSIHLRHNRLQILTPMTSSILNQIPEKSMDNNPWICSCSEEDLLLMQILIENLVQAPCCPKECNCQTTITETFVKCNGTSYLHLNICLPWPNTHLDISSMNLNEISLNFWKIMDNIIGLNISNNNISSFESINLPSLTKLQYFDLSMNNFSLIKPLMAERLKRIPNLELSKNRWKCSCKEEDAVFMEILAETIDTPPCCPDGCKCKTDAITSLVDCKDKFQPILSDCIPWKNSHIDFSNTSLSKLTLKKNFIQKNVVTLNLSFNQLSSLDGFNSNLFPNLRFMNLQYNNLENLSKLELVKHLNITVKGNDFNCLSCLEISEFGHISDITCHKGNFKQKEDLCFLTNTIVPSIFGSLILCVSVLIISHYMRRFLRKRINPWASNGVRIVKIGNNNSESYGNHQASLLCYKKLEQLYDSVIPSNFLIRLWNNQRYVIFEKWEYTLNEILSSNINYNLDHEKRTLEINNFSITVHQLFMNMLEALSQLHNINITHNCINLDSFFLVKESDFTFKVKLGSFFKWSISTEDEAMTEAKAADVSSIGKIMAHISTKLGFNNLLMENLVSALTISPWTMVPSCCQALCAPFFLTADTMIDIISDTNDNLLNILKDLSTFPRNDPRRLTAEYILEKIEKNAIFVFSGHSNWIKNLDKEICLEFCKRGTFKITSVMDLNRFIRNVVHHKEDHLESLGKTIGKKNPSKTEIFSYFISMFPPLFLHIFSIWKTFLEKEENIFAKVFLDLEESNKNETADDLQKQNKIFISMKNAERELVIKETSKPIACIPFLSIKENILEQMGLSMDEITMKLVEANGCSKYLNPNSSILDGSMVLIESLQEFHLKVSFKNLPNQPEVEITKMNVNTKIFQVLTAASGQLPEKVPEGKMKLHHFDDNKWKKLDKNKRLKDYQIDDNSILAIDA